MHKLHLDVDALAVESFETIAPGTRARGTVLGHDPVLFTSDGTMPCALSDIGPCPIALSDDDPTCMISCGRVSCEDLVCTTAGL